MSGASEFLLLILRSSPSGAGKTTLTRSSLERFPELRFSRLAHDAPAARQRGRRQRLPLRRSRGASSEMVARGRVPRVGRGPRQPLRHVDRRDRRARHDRGSRGMIFDIDYQGARQISAKVPDVVGVFILPPSMQELERRLRGRASETEEAVQRRFDVRAARDRALRALRLPGRQRRPGARVRRARGRSSSPSAPRGAGAPARRGAAARAGS